MLRRLVVLLGFAVAGLRLAAAPAAFDASPAWPAPFVPRLKPAPAPEPGAILRHLTVEDRVGEPRTDELVRVPLFLHDDEPNHPAAWALYAESDTDRRHPLVFQLDDLRHDSAGRLTRCHLYFTATLAAWERQRFVLVAQPPDTPSAPAATATATRSGDRVTLAGQDLAVTFLAAGPRAGALVALAPRGASVDLPDGWIAPRLTLVRQAADCRELRQTGLDYAAPGSLEIREVRYGAGPLFAKFAVRLGPRGVPDSAEFTYRVPLHGAVLWQTERLAPEGEPTAEVVGATDHQLLAGRLRLGGSPVATVHAVPAGLRRLTRATSGHMLNALVAPEARLALLAVPAVQTGGGAIETGRNATLAIAGPDSFRRNQDANSATLRAFWGEMQYIFTRATDDEALWHEGRRRFQPLVAIVDEPALGPADGRAAMPAIAQRFREIQGWGRQWPQDAALLWLERDRDKLAALLARKPAKEETDPVFQLPTWARAEPPLPRNPKDQGRIDPYQLGYGSSVLPLLNLLTPEPRRPATARAIGLASRRAFGRVNAAGFPYVDCFATAFNMQLGPLGLALCGARDPESADPKLAAWALDALHAPAVTALYGHGQRAYPGETRRPEASDFLYEAISDFHLRSLELAAGEDLWVHPAALGRYLDCVDVTADLQHRALPDAAGKTWYRANFFRGQAHDHRWENWSAGPLLGLFARREDRGRIGSTEAAYWLDQQGRTRQPWAELMWFAHTDLLLELLDRLPAAQAAPPLPADVRTARTNGGIALRWSAVPGAAAYRVYRAKQAGGPWTWLNSPYTVKPAPALTATAFADPAGRGGDVYLVTAVDAEGRESRWYGEEPRQ